MEPKIIRVNIDLENIHCYDEGDGWGSAEPYLWTVFFKIDGETTHITDSLTLSGSPTIHTTRGSHGNLGDTDVNAGDTINIPANIGEWETFLKPIPGPGNFSVGGALGVVAILMEEDNVSDAGAEAGYAALNTAVRDSLQQVINNLSITNREPSEDKIKEYADSIESKIKDAVVSQQNFFENIWSWSNPDDTIGQKVFLFMQSDLVPPASQNFSQRWKNEGDWELFGHITSSSICPGDALSELIDSIDYGSISFSSDVNYDLEPMRKFRDGPYREMPGLEPWFTMVEQHTGRIIRLSLAKPDLLPSIHKMLEWGSLIAQEPDLTLPPDHVEHVKRLLGELSKHRNRHARKDARVALSVLEVLKNKTHREAMGFLASTAPGRKQK